MARKTFQKNSQYFKKYQVKFARRRACKTDYLARKCLLSVPAAQADSKKHRLIVRFTNSKVICQIAYATMTGDFIVAQATSKELAKYGVNVGLTNFSAAYLTGLLCGRRMMTTYKVDKYALDTPVVGESGPVNFSEEDGDRRFTVHLDVGINATTKGAKVFAAMKGCSDSGVLVPFSEKCLFGYDSEEEKWDSEAFKARALGCHVAEYMKLIQSEDQDAYQRQFGEYIKNGIDADNLSATYEKCIQAIWADPSFQKKPQRTVTRTIADGVVTTSSGNKYKHFTKSTNAERKARLQTKLAKIASLIEATA